MYILNIDRVQLLRSLPKNGICAEIGVYRGAYSNAILKMAAPKLLHLIDPWRVQDPTYKLDTVDMSDEENEIRYREVLNMFKKEIKHGAVQIHRTFSNEIASRFDDQYFNWVYIDALHRYQDVRMDLEIFYPKVKDGGFILGHDFTNRTGPVNQQFGVVEAVMDFLRHAHC